MTCVYPDKMLGEGRSAKGPLPLLSVQRTLMLTCCIFRHAMLVDQTSEAVTVPLNAAMKSEGRLELANSTSPLMQFDICLTGL